jgi:hypothetical protein
MSTAISPALSRKVNSQRLREQSKGRVTQPKPVPPRRTTGPGMSIGPGMQKTRNGNQRETSNHLRRSNNGKRFPVRGQKNKLNFANRLGLKNNNPTLRRSNLNPGNTKVGVVRGLFRQVKKLVPGLRRGNQNSRQVSNNRTVTPTRSTNNVNSRQVSNNRTVTPMRSTNNVNSRQRSNNLLGAQPILLKNMTRGYLQSCFLNTYTTLSYLTGQSKITDGTLARYIISFDTLLFKMNNQLTSSREKMLEDLWNRTKNSDNRNTEFSSEQNIEKVLNHYKTVMRTGFGAPNNKMQSFITNAFK